MWWSALLACSDPAVTVTTPEATKAALSALRTKPDGTTVDEVVLRVEPDQPWREVQAALLAAWEDDFRDTRIDDGGGAVAIGLFLPERRSVLGPRTDMAVLVGPGGVSGLAGFSLAPLERNEPTSLLPRNQCRVWYVDADLAQVCDGDSERRWSPIRASHGCSGEPDELPVGAVPLCAEEPDPGARVGGWIKDVGAREGRSWHVLTADQTPAADILVVARAMAPLGGPVYVTSTTELPTPSPETKERACLRTDADIARAEASAAGAGLRYLNYQFALEETRRP